MPKDPILSRECYYDKRRDGQSYRDLDWNLVNTNLGAMVEPRVMSLVTTTSGSGMTNLDPDDLSFNRRVQMDETTMFSVLGTAGLQLPLDYNLQ